MKDAIKVINELKKKGLIKGYAIGGAIGVLKWVEPFFTRDLDIFIITSEELKVKEVINLSTIYDYLKAKGYNKWVGQWIIIDGVPIEFIPAVGLGQEAVENAVPVEFQNVKTRVMAPEYLIALLLRAGRDKDKRKIEMLLQQAEINRKKLNEILSKYSLNERFKRLIEEKQNEG